MRQRGRKPSSRDSLLPLKYCESRGTFDSFSRNHTIPYSTIALQEMNLYYHYPHVYWQCACLTVNAAADENDKASGTTNYGKIATAISNMQRQGVIVDLPDINEARYGFRPDVERGRIIFGLRGINGIGDDTADALIANRPYASIEDVCQRVPGLSRGDAVTLVKAGAFDRLYTGVSRTSVMRQLLLYQAQQACSPKAELGMRNFSAVCKVGILPPAYAFLERLTAFRSAVRAMPHITEQVVRRGRTVKDVSFPLAGAAQFFFEGELAPMLQEGEQYSYGDSGQPILHEKPMEKWYQQQIAPLVKWLQDPATVELFNRASIIAEANATWAKYCQGTPAHWEMEALSYYHGQHELASVDMDAYSLSDFFSLPTEPEVVAQEKRTPKDKTEPVIYEKYKLSRICGTVLDKNKTRHSISLLTPTGVVNVKYYAGAFAHYDKQISQRDADGKGTVLEKSWFARGTLLLLTGVRRGDRFFPKRYRDSIWQHTTSRITQIHNGRLELQNERVKPE